MKAIFAFYVAPLVYVGYEVYSMAAPLLTQ